MDQATVTRNTDPLIEVKQQTAPNKNDNGLDDSETASLSTPCSDQDTVKNNGRHEDGGGKTEDEGGGPGRGHFQTNRNPNGWSKHFPPSSTPQKYNGQAPPSQSHSTCTLQRQAQAPNGTKEQHQNVVLRRGFVPRTAPERVAQRKSSMAQLQHWVNQRRVMVSQEDMNR